MYRFPIKLSTIEDVRKFVTIASTISSNVTVRSNFYVVDGKSLLGLFSLDLSKPINVEVDKKEYIDLFKNEFSFV